MNWFGVLPAMTTPFTADLAVDHEFLSRHAAWLLENGCHGLVALGSLGEGATLEHSEKIAILKTALKASQGKGTPVVAAISSLSTSSR
jgi:dihydrodipicolinate synthase/N-acetylneuraminate lyase